MRYYRSLGRRRERERSRRETLVTRINREISAFSLSCDSPRIAEKAPSACEALFRSIVARAENQSDRR